MVHFEHERFARYAHDDLAPGCARDARIARDGHAATTSRGAAGATTLGPIFAARGPWLGGRETATEVAGKVVVVDVFTVDCFNCRNVTPTLRALHRRPNVIVIGVHTPETSYERERAHIVDKLAELGVTWPVVLDDDQRVWNAFGIEAWPTQLFFDRNGTLRHTVVGDSQDNDVLATVAKLAV